MFIRELADRSLQSKISYISKSEAFSYFIQIMEALRYLHDDLKIPHGNLKITNILYKKGLGIQLSDIGKFNNILRKKMLTLKSDVWAAGIILHIMLSRGKHPFDINGTKNPFEIVENVKAGNIKLDKTIQKAIRLKILKSNNFSNEIYFKVSNYIRLPPIRWKWTIFGFKSFRAH